jgi:hypothetical protein
LYTIVDLIGSPLPTISYHYKYIFKAPVLSLVVLHTYIFSLVVALALAGSFKMVHHILIQNLLSE